MKNLAVALCLLATGAGAQEVEQVTVYGGSLTGVWKVAAPSYVQITLLGRIHWGPLHDGFCRIDRDATGYATHCFGQGDAGRGGTLETDGTHFHLAWGTMLARMVFDGTAESATRFTGHFAIKLAGITMESPDTSEGSKMEIRADTPDAGGKAEMLRAILGGAQPPHDAALDGKMAAARGLAASPIAAISYLGQQTKGGGPGKPTETDYYTAYAVTMESGVLLCALHQKPDGMLDAFQCV
jgi:hypothetical protein